MAYYTVPVSLGGPVISYFKFYDTRGRQWAWLNSNVMYEVAINHD